MRETLPCLVHVHYVLLLSPICVSRKLLHSLNFIPFLELWPYSHRLRGKCVHVQCPGSPLQECTFAKRIQTSRSYWVSWYWVNFK